MNENFENNEFFQQLPEETKEKLRNCKSEEEAMEVLKSDMIPIPDDALDDVAGGQCYHVYWGDGSPCGSNNPCTGDH